MGQWMDGYLQKLEKVRREGLIGGGEDRIRIQHDLGKLTARERIHLLRIRGPLRKWGSSYETTPFTDRKTAIFPARGTGSSWTWPD